MFFRVDLCGLSAHPTSPTMPNVYLRLGNWLSMFYERYLKCFCGVYGLRGQRNVINDCFAGWYKLAWCVCVVCLCCVWRNMLCVAAWKISGWGGLGVGMLSMGVCWVLFVLGWFVYGGAFGAWVVFGRVLMRFGGLLD